MRKPGVSVAEPGGFNDFVEFSTENTRISQNFGISEVRGASHTVAVNATTLESKTSRVSATRQAGYLWLSTGT